MSRVSEKQLAFLRSHNIQSTPPNRQIAANLVRFINEPNYYSKSEESPQDRVTAILALEHLWLGRRFVITGEHHPRRGEIGIVTHIKPVYDIWDGRRSWHANLAHGVSLDPVEELGSKAEPPSNLDILELGVTMDKGNQIKGRRNVDGLYVHLVTRVAEN